MPGYECPIRDRAEICLGGNWRALLKSNQRPRLVQNRRPAESDSTRRFTDPLSLVSGTPFFAILDRPHV